MTSRMMLKKQERKNLGEEVRKGRRVFGEVADRELKDVDEKDDDEHEGTSPRV
jgi:hypothetical protein